MNKTLFLLSCLLFAGTTKGYIEKKVLVGSIQFPKAVKSIPNVRMYYRGNKIKNEIDNEGKKITFSFSEHKYLHFFYLLIVDSFTSETEDNTIKYLKINTHKPYKLFSLELLPDNSWRIRKQMVPPTGRIPDESIIICYNPTFVDAVSGGSQIELPKVCIKENIISLVGSEALLHDKSAEILLSALDYDAIHTTVKQAFWQNLSLKTIVALDI